jgi:hypothetical protein
VNIGFYYFAIIKIKTKVKKQKKKGMNERKAILHATSAGALFSSFFMGIINCKNCVALIIFKECL